MQVFLADIVEGADDATLDDAPEGLERPSSQAGDGHTKPALARALNRVGEQTARGAAQFIADQAELLRYRATHPQDSGRTAKRHQFPS